MMGKCQVRCESDIYFKVWFIVNPGGGGGGPLDLFPGLVSSLPGILCDFEWFLWDSEIFKVDLV